MSELEQRELEKFVIINKFNIGKLKDNIQAGKQKKSTLVYYGRSNGGMSLMSESKTMKWFLSLKKSLS